MKVTVCQLDNREQERAAMLDELAKTNEIRPV